MGAANGIKPLSEHHFAGTRSRIFSYVYQQFICTCGIAFCERMTKNGSFCGIFTDFCWKFYKFAVNINNLLPMAKDINRKKFQFKFENGEVLRLKLYEHLKF